MDQTQIEESKKDTISFFEKGNQALKSKNFTEALNYFQQEYKIRLHNQATNPKSVLEILGVISYLHSITSNLQGEIETYKLIIEQQRTVNTPELQVNIIEMKLACAYSKNKQYSEALNLYQQIFPNFEKQAPQYMPSLYYELGEIYLKLNQYDDSIEFYLLCIKKIAPSNPIFTPICFNVGICFFRKGLLDESLRYLNRALELDSYKLGENHKEVGKEHGQLGLIYLLKRNFVKAEENFIKSLKIAEKHSTPSIRDIIVQRNNLGQIFASQQLFDKATEQYNISVDIIKQELDQQKFNDVLKNSYINIANSYKEANKIENCIKYYATAKEIEIDMGSSDDNNNAQIDQLIQSAKNQEEYISFIQKNFTQMIQDFQENTLQKNDQSQFVNLEGKNQTEKVKEVEIKYYEFNSLTQFCIQYFGFNDFENLLALLKNEFWLNRQYYSHSIDFKNIGLIEHLKGIEQTKNITTTELKGLASQFQLNIAIYHQDFQDQKLPKYPNIVNQRVKDCFTILLIIGSDGKTFQVGIKKNNKEENSEYCKLFDVNTNLLLYEHIINNFQSSKN